MCPPSVESIIMGTVSDIRAGITSSNGRLPEALHMAPCEGLPMLINTERH